MLIAVLLALCLIATTFVFHFRVLLWLGRYAPRFKLRAETQVLIIVLVLFFTHLVEIGLYAIIYSWSVLGLELGLFKGAPVNDLMNYLYYSGVIYTTLGLGDIHPEGHIRFITAMEALNGFLLITWSASFTFLAMRRLWQWDNCGNGSSGDKLGSSNEKCKR